MTQLSPLFGICAAAVVSMHLPLLAYSQVIRAQI